MKKACRFFGVFLFLLAINTQSFAWTLKGHGNISCGTFITERDEGGAMHYGNMAWVYGFISGINYNSDGSVGKGLDSNAISLALANYCNKNPLKTLADASENLYSQMK